MMVIQSTSRHEHLSRHCGSCHRPKRRTLSPAAVFLISWSRSDGYVARGDGIPDTTSINRDIQADALGSAAENAGQPENFTSQEYFHLAALSRVGNGLVRGLETRSL
jgi:hypothetical protein